MTSAMRPTGHVPTLWS